MREISIERHKTVNATVSTTSGAEGVTIKLEKNKVSILLGMSIDEAWVLAHNLLDDVRHAEQMRLQLAQEKQ